MSMIDTRPAPADLLPPVFEVGAAQFATLGFIKIAERAVKKHGPIVTLDMAGGHGMTILSRAHHAAFWQANPELFFKDTASPASGVSMTRAILGRTLLTASAGDEWKKMRRDMTQLLGASKQWFQRPLAGATQQLVRDMQASPNQPLLDHCIAWAARAICEPLIGSQVLDKVATDMVHKLNACFLAVMASEPTDMAAVDQGYLRVMRRIAQERGPDSIAEQIIGYCGPDATPDDVDAQLKSTVGGLLVASLHINALSLFWALQQIADAPDLQVAIRAEAQAWDMSPRRVVDTPLAFAAIREAQRIKPVMSFIERQLRAPVILDGFELPAGETVLFSPWLVQRSADVWDEPLRFDPQRFETGRRLKPGSYFPFGIGERICPGTNLVNQQLTFALSGVCLALNLAPDPQTRPGDVTPMFRVNLEPKGPVRLRSAPVV